MEETSIRIDIDARDMLHEYCKKKRIMITPTISDIIRKFVEKEKAKKGKK